MNHYPVLECFGVSQKFAQVSALNNLSLSVNEGEKVGLIGSSGAGKSTLIKLLNGTLRPSEGQITILGRNLSQLSPHRLRQVQQQIGTIYQQFQLIESLKVIHNINAGHLGRWPLWKAAISLIYPLEIKMAVNALEKVGIPDKIYARTDQLSGGQQQRVAIARVLVQDPTLILADEPTSSLDPSLSQEIMKILSDICDKHGKTLVISLHSLDLALQYCDRLIGLYRGNLLFDAPTSQVTQSMLDELYE